MLGDELPKEGYQLGRHFHHCVLGAREGGFVLGDGVFVALVFIMLQDVSDPLLVPAGGKLVGVFQESNVHRGILSSPDAAVLPVRHPA
jgi:hypothetical protein